MKRSGDRTGTTTGARCDAGSQQHHHDYRFHPGQAGTVECVLDGHRSRRQEHGINGSKIVILAVENEEDGIADQVTPAQHAVDLQPLREEERNQASDPDGRGQRKHQQRLLEEILQQRQHDIATFSPDVRINSTNGQW